MLKAWTCETGYQTVNKYHPKPLGHSPFTQTNHSCTLDTQHKVSNKYRRPVQKLHY
jgi:hypothetical protein